MSKSAKHKSNKRLEDLSLDELLDNQFENIAGWDLGDSAETVAKRRRSSSEQATGSGRESSKPSAKKSKKGDLENGGARAPSRKLETPARLPSSKAAEASVEAADDASARAAAAASNDGDTGGFQLFARPPSNRPRPQQQASIRSAGPGKRGQTVSAAGGTGPDADMSAGTLRGRLKAAGGADASFDEGDDADEGEAGRVGTELLPPMVQSQALGSGGFKALGLNDWLVANLKAVNIVTPTPVQSACIPKVLSGIDVIGTAQTGSGKTAAFALPILQTLAEDPYGVYAVVLTPTRELAFQICDQFVAFGAGMTFHALVVVGGEDMRRQSTALARRPHVIVGTPGRLVDHIRSDPAVRAALARCRFLVLDEADRLLEPAVEEELEVIAEALPKKQRQTLLFSATITRGIAALQEVTLRRAFHFEAYEGLQTADGLKQEYLLVPAKVKEVYLAYLLQAEQLEARKVRSVLVFCGTVRSCQLMGDMLQELGIDSAVLHSAKPQKYRLANLDKFRSRRATILIATDVASRGLDIPSVDMVVNADVPSAPEDYVHRTGRTARAGRGGLSVTLVTQYDVERVKTIEKHVGKEMELFEVDEAEVLKNITAVFAARRTASMRMAEPGGFDALLAERKKKNRAGKAAMGIAAR